MGSKRPHDEVEGEAGAPTTAPEAKKRKGFRVGPDNLPDGAWRRKNTKIKHELIHKAKVKKDYAKVKAELQKEREAQDKPAPDAAAAEEPQVHPNRQQRMDDEQLDREHMNPERQAFLDGKRAPPRRQARREEDNRQDEGQQGEHEDGATPSRPITNATTKSYPPAPEPKSPEPKRRRGERHKRRPDYYDRALEEGSRKKAEAEAKKAEAERREQERARSIDERERTRRAMLKAKGFSASGKPRGKPKLGRESKVLLDKVKRMVGA